MAERSLLQQIREKELTLNIKIQEVRKEAEELILEARNKASHLIEDSEREGKKAAQEYYDKEMEKIQTELVKLKNKGSQQATAIRAAGERNIPSATEKIVKEVLMG